MPEPRTRRTFLKAGGMRAGRLRGSAAISPAGGSRRRKPRQGAGRGVPARRRGRPEHGGAPRRSRLFRDTTLDRAPAAQARRERARPRPRRLLRAASGARAARAALGESRARPGPRVRVPDTTRSHFDAQDYMESGTPGVKSTPDGWLARAIRRAADEARRPFRAVAMGPALPRTLQGDVGAISMQSIERFDVRGGADANARAGLRGALRAGRPRSPARDRPRDLRRGEDAPQRQRLAHPPANGAEYPRGPLRRGAAADRPAHQGQRRPRGRVRRHAGLGHARRPGRRARPAGAPVP